MISRSFTVLLVLGLFAVVFHATSWAGERKIDEFFGEYTGKSLTGSDLGLKPRDLRLSIKPKGEGFIIDWLTVIPKANGKVARRRTAVEFQRSRLANLYESAMRKDMFGNPQPLDPMKGEPYVWARLTGDTLSTYILLVIEGGSYEMQAYHRTLIPGGLRVRFTRQREDQTLRVVEAVLKRTND